MAGQGAALRDWVVSRRLSANQVDGRVLVEIGGIFEMALQPVLVVRPDDLLVLEFRFVNLRRQGGKLVRGRGAGPALLIVAHQFQSVGEEAFPEITDAGQQGFEADPKLKGRNPPADPGVTIAALPAQAKVRAAGESRTVHAMPQGHPGIDWTLPALLAAVRDWPLALDGSARPDDDDADLRLRGRIRLFDVSKNLRATVMTARAALGDAFDIAALDTAAAAVWTAAIGARRTTPEAAVAAGALLVRRADAAVTRSRRARAAAADAEVDDVIAAIYVRAQASRRAVIAAARDTRVGIADIVALPGAIFFDFLKPDPPTPRETAIEMPYRLIASPLATGGFDHALEPVAHTVGGSPRTELWHSRLGTRRTFADGPWIDDRPGTPTESGGWKGERLRFIWSPDYPEGTIESFRKPLDELDRRMLVKLTAGFDEKQQDGKTRYNPRAAFVRRLMLTAMGGDLEAHRKFDPRPQGADLSAWTHRSAIGRDYFVRVEYSGFLFPFGHRATLVKLTERKFQWRAVNDRVAFLRQRFFIVVRDRTIEYPGAAPQEFGGRSLPFTHVTCAVDVTPDLDAPGGRAADRLPPAFYVPDTDSMHRMAFWPSRGANNDYRFPLVGTDGAGRRVAFEMPLLFISELRNTSADTDTLRTYWNGAAAAARRVAPLAGQTVRMAPASPGAEDVDLPLIDAEIRAAKPTSGISATPGKKLQQYPRFGAYHARLAAIERLTGQPRPEAFKFYQPYLDGGMGAGAVFAEITGGTKLSFDGANPSSSVGGIATPDLSPSGLSARHGVASGAIGSVAGGNFDPAAFFPDAKLLGFYPLKLLLAQLPMDDSGKTPKITTVEAGDKIRTTFAITQTLKTGEPLPGFLTGAGGHDTVFTLDTRVDAPRNGGTLETQVTGTLTNFRISFFGALIIHFDRLRFLTVPGRKPDVDVDLNPETGVTFGGALEFINKLKDFIPANGFSDPPNLDVTPTGITAGYSLGLPAVQVGILALSNITLGASFSLPFTGKPPTARFNFAERQNTFNLTVAMFGGGGFVAMVADTSGIQEIEAQLDFGAQIAINLGVASGSVYVKGGFYFHYATEAIQFEGFVEMGGRLSVLGLISVSLTFHLGLTYELLEKAGNNGIRSCKLFGQATLTVEIEILFFSMSVDVSVEKTFVGAEADPTFADLLPDRAMWSEYCAAYA
jgi:hypothetical protein